MRRALCLAAAGVLAAVVAAPAAAAPAILVTTSCAYTGGRFAIAGSGFDPGASVALEIMATGDPLAGAALAGRAAAADAQGDVVAILDVPPPTDTETGAAVRAVRARPAGDERPTPLVLASASLRSVSRGVRISPRTSALRASATERWRLTGLPEGTALYAHYRRAGRTVARRGLGAAVDPCGRLDIELPVLPRRARRRGAWEVWMTADRTFRRPLNGV
ncbi:MAG TPA: hypothetical protein VGO80_22170, partial [Solirubrobacteraceae bacterium]|nr:hypothetical protein [Solirubrobacteraceae bacterium]